MPTNALSILSSSKLARILAFGDAKCKKTWWAAKAAEAGYNVLLIDGDDGASICKNLSEQALNERLWIVDAVDSVGVPVFKNFMTLFARDHVGFAWDCTTKSPCIRTSPEHDCFRFDISKLTANDVIVIDSWKALAWSVLTDYAKTANIALSDADKVEWDGYGYEGRFLEAVANSFKRLPCHVIVIGHSYEYSKMSKPKPGEKAKVLWSKTIQVSSSSNNAFSLLAQWTDILYFRRVSDTAIFIETGGDDTRVGGCRSMKPGTHRWEQLTAESVLGLYPRSEDRGEPKGWTYLPAGSTPVDSPAAARLVQEAQAAKAPQKAIPVVGRPAITLGTVGANRVTPNVPPRKF